ncbi:MAG: helix-hairpin-helix domain-containing protein [Balneolaceae bacterium]|nr:helix-hairpin-helix domain-containing protein [Balneolaceae bacterium]
MMRRKLFFWLEKLRITPQERVTVVALLVLLALLTLLNHFVVPPSPFGPSHYRELEEEFRRRSAMLAEREARLMERYFPDPASPSAAAPPDTVTGAEHGVEKVDINTADVEQLQTIPGIGPSYARRIVAYRAEYGLFRSIEELTAVKGIGPRRLESLKPYITVE